MSEFADLAFCQRFGKVELHAHLSGSIRISTLEELIQSDGGGSSEELSSISGTSRSMENCFRLFNLIHKYLVSSEQLRRVIRETVEDYVSENTVYLELRTTPRALSDFPSDGQRKYIEVLVDEIAQMNQLYQDKIMVRILLSVNRGYSLAEAQEIIDLAIELSARSPAKEAFNNIVGIDFSGNPSAKGFIEFKDLFMQARTAGLKVSIHFAEVYDSADTEAILQFAPDRLGHGCCVEDGANSELFHKLRIPLEVCPTSNLMTRPELGGSYNNHPVGDLIDVNYPISINTDDRGVFDVTLSHEYFRVAEAFKLTKEQVRQIALNSVEHSFASADDIVKLKIALS
jgi:adenosine deaminase